MDILYAWIASIASATTPLVIKASSRSLVKSSWLFNLLWVGFSIPFIAGLALIKGGGIPTHWTPLLLLAGCYAIYYVSITSAVYKLDVTVVAPLFSLRAAFAVLLGLLFLDEKISALGLMLIILIILAIPLAAYNEKLRLKSFMHAYIFIAIFAMAMLAFVGYFSHQSVKDNGYATTLLWQGVLTFLFLLPTLQFISSSREQFTKYKLSPFLILGFSGFIYTVTATTAFAHNLALSSVIVSLPLSMVFAYILGRAIPRFSENQATKVYAIRFTGAFIMVSSAVLLSFTR